VRFSVGQLHHARLGVTPKTVSNHRSNLRAALRWFGKEEGVPQQGAPLSPEWARFAANLDMPIRQRLYNLVRYCSARRIRPSSVEDKVLDNYWEYRSSTTRLATHNTAKRFMARAWNACAADMTDASLQRLTEPPLKTTEPAWEKFPAGLRRDLDNYFTGLAKPHRSLDGKRIRPCRPVAGSVIVRRRCRTELSSVVANQRQQIKIVETGEMVPMTAPDQVLISGVLQSDAVASIHLKGGTANGTGFLFEIHLRHEIAHRHVFNHAPAQRADALIGHGILLSEQRLLTPRSSDRTTRPVFAPTSVPAATLRAALYRASGFVVCWACSAARR